MKKITLTLILLAAIFACQPIYAQDTTNTNTDIKTGWNMGVLPALGYDSNLGLLYGAILNMFNYGNGERYPDFNHNLYLQLSTYTKGGMDAILFFDSYTLVPEKHFTGRLSYTRNRAYPFYGFNGKQTVYDPSFTTSDESDFLTQVYYKYDRSLLKGDLILQDNIGQSNFQWMVGLDMSYYKTASVDVEHLNKNKDEEDLIADTATLYDNYVDWGIISDEEKEGGFDNSIKLGLVYDTRDRITHPMKGVWTELITRTAPQFLGNHNDFFKVSLIHRQYFTLKKEKLSFAYRLWYEGAFGQVPYYSRTYLTASNYYEGMGGAYSLRGVLMNRVVGKQTAIANAELRWKAHRFRWINQNFYLGVNAFTDAGYQFEAFDMDLGAINPGDSEKYFSDEYKEMIYTVGMGLQLVMNENFVVSAEYASTFDEAYGKSGLYVKVGYLF